MEINLPKNTTVGTPCSDALQDLNIRLDHLCNFIGEILLLKDISINPKEDLNIKPSVRDSVISKSVSTPTLKVNKDQWNQIEKDLWEQLFYSSIVRLITTFEVFLKEILKELFYRNIDLVLDDQKQLKNSEIFNHKDINSLKRELIDRKILSLLMKSYPKLYKALSILLKIDFHGKKSPMTLMETHDLYEIRNIIVHGDGYGKNEYDKRMGHYENYEECYAYGQYGIKLDFIWLFNQIDNIRALSTFIDSLINDKWKTSKHDYLNKNEK